MCLLLCRGFENTSAEDQPHLAYLCKAGIVGSRREGPWMHYRIVEPADPDAARVLWNTLAWLDNDPEMQRDRERLSDALNSSRRNRTKSACIMASKSTSVRLARSRNNTALRLWLCTFSCGLFR